MVEESRVLRVCFHQFLYGSSRWTLCQEVVTWKPCFRGPCSCNNSCFSYCGVDLPSVGLAVHFLITLCIISLICVINCITKFFCVERPKTPSLNACNSNKYGTHSGIRSNGGC
jgi:hypothetical protein